MSRKVEDATVENKILAPSPKTGWQVDKSVTRAPNTNKGAEIAYVQEPTEEQSLRGIEHAQTDLLRQQTGDPDIEAKSGGISTMRIQPSQKEYETYSREKKAEHANRKEVVESADAKYDYETFTKAREKHKVFHPDEKGTGIGPFETGDVLRNLEAEHATPRPHSIGDPVSETADMVNKPRGEVHATKKGIVCDEKGRPLEQDLTKFQDRPTPVPQGKAQNLSYAQVTAVERNPDIAWNENPEEANQRRIDQENPPIGPACGPEGPGIRRTGNITKQKPLQNIGTIADEVGLPQTREMRDLQGQGNVLTANDLSDVARKDNKLDSNISGNIQMERRAI